ncbi:MAG: GerMN domain-containing protein [Acidimicrobiales bacterium]
MSRNGRLAAAMAALAGLVLAGCGSGGTGPVGAGTVPRRATTTTVPGAAGGTESTTGGGGTGASEAEVGSPAGPTTQVALYFIRGERLERVNRAVPKVTRIGAEAVKALLGGPNADERAAGLATAIPAATQFRDLVINDGTARVDLSRAFESGGGGLGLTLRLAQVACTLDAFPSVTGVRFALDGELVEVLSGDGVVVDRPVSCDSYAEHLGDGSPPPAAETFAGIWPFATSAELDAYAAGGDGTYRDPVVTARAFADQYLGITSPTTFGFRSVAPGMGQVPVGFGRGEGGRVLPDPQPTTVIELSQLGAHGDDGPWTVVRASSPQILVDNPFHGIPRISSPVSVSGRAHVFEGTVTVEVREDGMTYGQTLGRSFVTGRGDELGPFSGQIDFHVPAKSGGAVVFYERSMADGGSPVLRATAVRVSF